MSKILNTNGLIIKYKNHKEYDRLYTILTEDRGKVVFLAKGVRKFNSRRLGNLDVLNMIAFSYIDREVFPLITEVKLLQSFDYIKTNLDKISDTYKILEFIDKFLIEEQKSEIYNLTIDALNHNARLVEGGRRLSWVNYIYKSLIILGYDPMLDFCILCMHDKKHMKQFYFSYKEGGLVCENCKDLKCVLLSLEQLEFIANIKNLEFTSLQQTAISKDVLLETESIINKYIEQTLEGKLKSLNSFMLQTKTENAFNKF